jgi:hypothetical protein
VKGGPSGHAEILAYLRETFPPWEVVPARRYAGTAAPVFAIVQNYVERQLEVDRTLLDEPDTLVKLLRTRRVAETMRDAPGRRLVVRLAGDGGLLVDVDVLRK